MKAGWSVRAGLKKRILAAAGGALALAMASVLAVPVASARPMPAGLSDLAERLSPAVVNISTTHELTEDESKAAPFAPPFGGPRPGEEAQSLGSGFVIDPSGVIVTNNHVIDGADKIEVTFTDGETLPAKLLGRDEMTDIAVLKVEPKTPLAHVVLGDSDHLRVGDWVMAIGNPFGLGGTVTVGIVSAMNRDIHAGNYDDFIQTDAAINRGNSGGPLFDLNGTVVGMNTAIISPSGESVGIGFATPASSIRSIVSQIRDNGEIRRGWIGVRIQTVTGEIAKTLGLEGRKGALVAGVSPDGPAAKAGIETGDLITGFDGKPVPEMRDLPRIVAETEIGKSVSVDIVRAGKPRKLTLKVGLLDEPKEADVKADAAMPAEADKLNVIGMELIALDATIRTQFGIPDSVQGALVSDVASGSKAAEKGVQAGDVIVRVGQAEVRSPKDVEAQITVEKKAGRASVLLRLINGASARFVAVPLN